MKNIIFKIYFILLSLISGFLIVSFIIGRIYSYNLWHSLATFIGWIGSVILLFMAGSSNIANRDEDTN